MLFVRGRLLILVLGLSICHAFGALATDAEDPPHRVHITNIDRTLHKNWLGIPRRVDCTIQWEAYTRALEGWAPAPITLFDSYRALCLPEGTGADLVSGEVSGNFWTFTDLRVGEAYEFVIEGYQGGMRSATSDTARMTTGREFRASQPGAASRWHLWIPFNGRIPMAFFGRGYVFDGATKPGKIAFHLIWNFLIIGGLIWFFFSRRHLSLHGIFPMSGKLALGVSFDKVYDRGILDEFATIIHDWRELVEKANDHMRDALCEDCPASVKEMERVNIDFWRKEGAARVKTLLEKTNKPELIKYPAVRIIRAGLENHELGGYRWLEVSKEVDRAIENRASSEQEKLRRNSLLDWLWNLGTLSPLIGLFGTATGISHAFATLTMLRADITQTTLVRRLATGIFEALWTTIEGLFVGIILMLLYYYYQNKLNWIYSKWEEIYVHISERL